MDPLFERILTARRKCLVGSKSLFESHKPAEDLADVEDELGVRLPGELRDWLAAAGYGDINNILSFRREWFAVIDSGALKSHVMFAQDDLGNLYSFSPTDGAIHFISRLEAKYAYLAKDFSDFLSQFAQRDFELQEWTDGLQAQSYHWRA